MTEIEFEIQNLDEEIQNGISQNSDFQDTPEGIKLVAEINLKLREQNLMLD